MIKLDLTGQKFGRLLVLKDSGMRTKWQDVIWFCLCDCGNLKEVTSQGLRSFHTKSCGCLYRETWAVIGKKRHKHGATNPRKEIYTRWISMKTRCYNANNKNYKTYGERGIKVCKDWRNDFVAFRNWALVNGYQKGLTIDRIDNDGNYEPSNCQWITGSENARKSWRKSP